MLYEKYHDKGFEVLDFPCDQFGHQAPGSNDEIHEKYKDYKLCISLNFDISE